MPKINNYQYPDSLVQAYELLGNPKSRIVAGGCSLIQQKTGDYDTLIDITGLPFKYIKEENSQIKIGATVSFNELATSPLLREIAGGIVGQAALSAASAHLRNQMTIGGNLVQPLWWCSLPPVFLALEAKVKLYAGQEKEISLEELYQKLPLKGEILTEIIFDKPSASCKGKFVKFSLTSQDLAILNLAVLLEGDRRNPTKVRLALGSAVPTPVRLKQTETFLQGKNLSSEILDNAVKIAQQEVKPLDEIRAGAKYRLELIKTLLKRTLAELAE